MPPRLPLAPNISTFTRPSVPHPRSSVLVAISHIARPAVNAARRTAAGATIPLAFGAPAGLASAAFTSRANPHPPDRVMSTYAAMLTMCRELGFEARPDLQDPEASIVKLALSR
jgi:hypothetical protein